MKINKSPFVSHPMDTSTMFRARLETSTNPPTKQPLGHSTILLTAKQLAERTEIKPGTLYMWAEMGKIPSLKLNGAVRFIWEDILEWMQGQRKGYTEITLARGSGKGRR